MNQVILKGRVGKNPETNNGVCKFSLATSKKWTDKQGNKQEKTSWHQIVSFSKQAEVLQKFVTKGQELLITGEIDYNEHDGKWYTSVIVREFEFCGSKQGESNQSKTNNEPDWLGDDPSDLPY